MDNLLEFGLVNNIFTTENVMSLIYGRMRYSYHTVAETQKKECFSEWYDYPSCINSWGLIPLEQRQELVTLIVKTIKESYTDYDCFHLRILSLLHYLLDDEENQVECIVDFPWGKNTTIERKYYAFFTAEQERLAVFEMFLWYQAGVNKTKEERRLLKQVWQKHLGCDNIRSQKRLVELAKQRVNELEREYQNATRKVKYNDALIRKRYHEERQNIKKKHLSKAKKEALLQEVEAKDNNAHLRFWHGQGQQMKCMQSLNFLNGFLDFAKMQK